MGKLESKSNNFDPNFFRLIRIVDNSISDDYIQFIKSPRKHQSISSKNSISSNVQNNLSVLEYSLELSSLILKNHLVKTINLDLVSATFIPNNTMDNAFDDNSCYVHNEIVKFINDTILWIDSELKKVFTVLNSFLLKLTKKQSANTTFDIKNNMRDPDNIFEILNSTKLSRQSSNHNDISICQFKKHKTSNKINQIKHKINMDNTSPQSSRTTHTKSRNLPNSNDKTQINSEKTIKNSYQGGILKINSVRKEKPKDVSFKCELKKESSKLNIKEHLLKSPNYSNLKKIMVPKDLIDNRKIKKDNSLVTQTSHKRLKTPLIPNVSNEKQSIQETKNIKNININIKLNIINKQGTVSPRTGNTSLIKSSSNKKILSTKRFEAESKSARTIETTPQKDKRKEIALDKRIILPQEKNNLKSDSDKSHETISSKKRNTPHFHLHKNTNSFGEKDFGLNDRFSFRPFIEFIDEKDTKFQNKSFIQYIEPKIKYQ